MIYHDEDVHSVFLDLMEHDIEGEGEIRSVLRGKRELRFSLKLRCLFTLLAAKFIEKFL